MLDFLVTGAGGNLGSVVLGQLARAGRSVLGTVSPQGPRPHHGAVRALDLCDPVATERLVRERRPRAVLHLAAMSVPHEVLRDPQGAARINVEATARLAALSSELGARFVFASTDLVFAGDAPPYAETDPPRPLSVYGRQKVQAEQAVLGCAGSVVARLPLMYGLPEVHRAPSFFLHVTRQLLEGEAPALFTDERRTLLDYASAGRALEQVAHSSLSGIVHLGGPESVSRFELGQALARALGCPAARLRPSSHRDANLPEPRPPDVSLSSTRHRQAFGAPPGRPLEQVLAELAEPLRRWQRSLAAAR